MTGNEQAPDLPGLLHAIDREACALEHLWSGMNTSADGTQAAHRLADAYAALDRAAAADGGGAEWLRGRP